ncbi:hypothetical protein V6N13_098873 [Hibiscus sabdariffa]|uniref:Uncharacterized protein n=1 Tax=Hibiscus sabdariffa TaxID=183260 RepID=A0ABR2EF68_9ROSI
MPSEGVFEFQFGAWLKVDSGKSKLDGVRRPKPGIVLTRKGAVAGDTLVLSNEGMMAGCHMQPMVTTEDCGNGIGMNPSKVAHSKRTHNRKDADGLALISK